MCKYMEYLLSTSLNAATHDCSANIICACVLSARVCIGYRAVRYESHVRLDTAAVYGK